MYMCQACKRLLPVIKRDNGHMTPHRRASVFSYCLSTVSESNTTYLMHSLPAKHCVHNVAPDIASTKYVYYVTADNYFKIATRLNLSIK